MTTTMPRTSTYGAPDGAGMAFERAAPANDAVPSVPAVPLPGDAAPELTGRFEGDGLAMELVERGGACTGTLHFGGSTFPLTAAATPDARLTQVYRHPVGIQLQYPDRWRAQEGQGFLQLIPPDQGTNAMGPTEVYVVTANPAPGITRPDDPRLIQFAEGQLAQVSPSPC